jgi:hypothetical protein
MEEFLVAALQFLLEFVLNVLGSVPFDWPSRYRRAPESGGSFARYFAWFAGGCVVAGVSLLVFKHSVITGEGLRIANLVLAPIASAFLSQYVALRRAQTNPNIDPRNHFWQAFWFTVGLVIIRFTYAAHA